MNEIIRQILMLQKDLNHDEFLVAMGYWGRLSCEAYNIASDDKVVTETHLRKM